MSGSGTAGATITATELYEKIAVDHGAVGRLFVYVFVEAHAATPPAEILLDLGATDDPVHAAQEGRFSHCYNGHYAACLWPA